jgi:hypothetical protein
MELIAIPWLPMAAPGLLIATHHGPLLVMRHSSRVWSCSPPACSWPSVLLKMRVTIASVAKHQGDEAATSPQYVCVTVAARGTEATRGTSPLPPSTDAVGWCLRQLEHAGHFLGPVVQGRVLRECVCVCTMLCFVVGLLDTISVSATIPPSVIFYFEPVEPCALC